MDEYGRYLYSSLSAFLGFYHMKKFHAFTDQVLTFKILQSQNDVMKSKKQQQQRHYYKLIKWEEMSNILEYSRTYIGSKPPANI